MEQIPNHNFTKVEPLNKGWSSDKKYYVETANGERLLLRVADISEYERKRAEFDMLKRIAELDIPASRPVNFGVCDDGKSVFQLLTWIDGEDAETVLPTLTETEQYTFGVQAGEILRKIHTILAPETQEDWAVSFNLKMEAKISEYHSSNIAFDGDEKLFAYLDQHENLLLNRPQRLQHGDFSLSNLLVSGGRQLFVVDFGDYDFGDPFEEFSITLSPFYTNYLRHFVSGQIRGYFGGNPSSDDWQILKYYEVCFLPTYLLWGNALGKDELDSRIKQTRELLSGLSDISLNPVPSWYLQNWEATT